MGRQSAGIPAQHPHIAVGNEQRYPRALYSGRKDLQPASKLTARGVFTHRDIQVFTQQGGGGIQIVSGHPVL